MIGALASRAASSEATTVEEEVTFCQRSAFPVAQGAGPEAYDGRDGKALLLGVVEELEDIISNNDTGLAGENVLATHIVILERFLRP